MQLASKLITAIFLELFLSSQGHAEPRNGAQFVVGSFMVTQKALNEAPHRYAGMIQKAMDLVDELSRASSGPVSCERASDKPSKLWISNYDNINITLQSNGVEIKVTNTFVETAVTCSLLKVLKLGTSIISGHFDLIISVEPLWTKSNKEFVLKVKEVKPVIHKIIVASGKGQIFLEKHPFFQNWLNSLVTSLVKKKAQRFELEVWSLTEFSLFGDLFVKCQVTDLIWTKEFVMAQVSGTVLASVDGKNHTFTPTIENGTFVPIDKWNTTSPKDGQSHLLHGVRVSNEFSNALLWYATITNKTRYSGNAQVFDSFIIGNVSSSPTEIRIDRDESLGIKISHGLVSATCRPENATDTKILFKAEFYNLTGNCKIILKKDSTENTAVWLNVEELDFTGMSIKPFEPKLPLPEGFEKELMKKGLTNLQPVLNDFFKSKSIIAPHYIAPFVKTVGMQILATGNGTGYFEISSYCTCSKTLTTPYPLCERKSRLCKETHEIQNQLPARAGNLDVPSQGFHLTFFEDDSNCKLNKFGSRAKVYWLRQTSQCEKLVMPWNSTQYYYFSATTLKIGCEDKVCQSCRYPSLTIDPNNQKDQCNQLNDKSYQVGAPEITHWETDHPAKSVVASQFFHRKICSTQLNHTESRLISIHTNLGHGETGKCEETDTEKHLDFEIADGIVKKAAWGCNNECLECEVEVDKDIKLNQCYHDRMDRRVMFTHAHHTVLNELSSKPIDSRTSIFVTVISFISIVILGILISVLVCERKFILKLLRSIRKLDFSGIGNELIKYCSSFKNILTKHIGIRFLTWKNLKRKDIQEDIIQNVMMICNGVMAILFAIVSNSDKNPLLTLHNKFSDGVSISVDIFDTVKVADFGGWLNLLTNFVNITNAVLAFSIVITWCFSKTGSRTMWMKVRLLSSVLLLSSIFVVIAAVIFSSKFDNLVSLKQNQRVIITDNEAMYNMASKVLKVSLSGMSLIVISFTIAFLFHGVGGGLYLGTVLFRLLHLHSKRSNMEIMTTLLVILTLIQPFICLHPVIIWSQDSNQNTMFLVLIILIWLLPVTIHTLSKATMTYGKPKFLSWVNPYSNEVVFRPQPGRLNNQRKFRDGDSKYEFAFDFAITAMEFSLFLASFSGVTHFILRAEFNQTRKNLQDFAIPAITSVLCWTITFSYLLLSIVLDESRVDSKLVFKDQNEGSILKMIRNSIDKRLQAAGILNSASYRRFSHPKRQSHPRSKNPTLGIINPAHTIPGFEYRPEDSPFINAEDREHSNSNKIQQMISKFETIGLIQGGKSQEQEGQNYPSHEEFSSDDDDVSLKKQDSSSNWLQIKRFYQFLFETREYKDPLSYGWRIKRRRFSLTVGVLLFTSLSINTVIWTQNFSSKENIQSFLNLAGMNFTWPESGSALDDVLNLYNKMERTKSYMMMGSSVLFWTSLILDCTSHFAKTDRRRSLLFSCSRLTNLVAAFNIFGYIIVSGLPDYLAASHLDQICAHCGENFNQILLKVLEFGIGLFFSCLFTFQLLPTLLGIAPSLIGAAISVLGHPTLQIGDDDLTSLRMAILQQVIQFASLLALLITFVIMCIIQQYHQDTFVTTLIICFWGFPPFVLFVALHYMRKYRRYNILLLINYVYKLCYYGIPAALLLYSLNFSSVVGAVQGMVMEPFFWISFFAQMFLCDVVISDLLYMAVF